MRDCEKMLLIMQYAKELGLEITINPMQGGDCSQQMYVHLPGGFDEWYGGEPCLPVLRVKSGYSDFNTIFSPYTNPDYYNLHG